MVGKVTGDRPCLVGCIVGLNRVGQPEVKLLRVLVCLPAGHVDNPVDDDARKITVGNCDGQVRHAFPISTRPGQSKYRLQIGLLRVAGAGVIRIIRNRDKVALLTAENIELVVNQGNSSVHSRHRDRVLDAPLTVHR